MAEITQKLSPVTKFPRASRDSPGHCQGPGITCLLREQSKADFPFPSPIERLKKYTGLQAQVLILLGSSTFASGGVTLISRRTLSTGLEKNPGPATTPLLPPLKSLPLLIAWASLLETGRLAVGGTVPVRSTTTRGQSLPSCLTSR